MLMLKRSQNFNVLSIFPKLINNILRLSAIAVFKPVMTWQKIQYGDLTQSGKNGQFPAVAVFVYLVL
jgi:hypothetical protein